VPVTAIGAKEQRSLVAGGAQGLSDTSAPKIWLKLVGPFLHSSVIDGALCGRGNGDGCGPL